MNVSVLWTLHFDRTDVSEKIDVNKIKRVQYLSLLRFLNEGFEPNISNRWHDFLMMSMNLSNIVILKIKKRDYHCIISGISKNEAINLMQNGYLTEEIGKLPKILIYNHIWKWVKKF